MTRMPPIAHRLVVLLMAVAALVTACSSDDSATTVTTTTKADPTTTTQQDVSVTIVPIEPSTTTAPEACSARSLPAATEPRDSLPDAVEATRVAIIEAALTCDYRALAEIASAGTRDFGFDESRSSDPAVLWAEQEVQGEEPMWYLVQIMRGPFSVVATGTIEYQFPSATGIEDWVDVPENIRRTLLEFYSEEDLARFEAAGTYTGHESAVSEDGEWLSYSSGE